MYHIPYSSQCLPTISRTAARKQQMMELCPHAHTHMCTVWLIEHHRVQGPVFDLLDAAKLLHREIGYLILNTFEKMRDRQMRSSGRVHVYVRLLRSMYATTVQMEETRLVQSVMLFTITLWWGHLFQHTVYVEYTQ